MQADQLRSILFAVTLVVVMVACDEPCDDDFHGNTEPDCPGRMFDFPDDSLFVPIGHDGFDFTADSIYALYEPADPACDSMVRCILMELCAVSSDHIAGLEQQLRYLGFTRDSTAYDSMYFVIQAYLRMVNELLLDCRNHTEDVSASLTVYRHRGRDGRGNVHFTGYYTPIVEADTLQDSVFRYPIYRYPMEWEGSLPTREAIEIGGALEGLGLEIAWAKNPLDVYYLQRQGSGYLRFPGGGLIMLSFAGTNGIRYQSISRELFNLRDDEENIESLSYFQLHAFAEENPDRMQQVLNHNASYVFFETSLLPPTGAAGLPLIPNMSIAVDPTYIPLGSVMLAQIPVTADRFTFSHYEWRILLPQDTGGGIRGPGRVDLYTGIGTEALRVAGGINFYGKLFLLMPNESAGIVENLQKLP